MAAAPIATPLWQFRSLENWAREIIIKELCPSSGTKVVQYGGGGFDLGKWFVLDFTLLYGIINIVIALTSFITMF